MFRAAVLVFPAALMLSSTADASEDDLGKSPLVWVQTYASVRPAVDGPPAGTPSADGQMGVATDVGFRLAVGQGKWTGSSHLLAGNDAHTDQLQGGFALGGWVQHESPRSVLPEHNGLSYGLSVTTFDQSTRGHLLATTFDAGIRQSLDSQGRVVIEEGTPFGQVQLGLLQEIHLFRGFFVGPDVGVVVGNEAGPWQLSTGLQLSSVL